MLNALCNTMNMSNSDTETIKGIRTTTETWNRFRGFIGSKGLTAGSGLSVLLDLAQAYESAQASGRLLDDEVFERVEQSASARGCSVAEHLSSRVGRL